MSRIGCGRGDRCGCGCQDGQRRDRQQEQGQHPDSTSPPAVPASAISGPAAVRPSGAATIEPGRPARVTTCCCSCGCGPDRRKPSATGINGATPGHPANDDHRHGQRGNHGRHDRATAHRPMTAISRCRCGRSRSWVTSAATDACADPARPPQANPDASASSVPQAEREARPPSACRSRCSSTRHQQPGQRPGRRRRMRRPDSRDGGRRSPPPR